MVSTGKATAMYRIIAALCVVLGTSSDARARAHTIGSEVEARLFEAAQARIQAINEASSVTAEEMILLETAVACSDATVVRRIFEDRLENISYVDIRRTYKQFDDARCFDLSRHKFRIKRVVSTHVFDQYVLSIHEIRVRKLPKQRFFTWSITKVPPVDPLMRLQEELGTPTND